MKKNYCELISGACNIWKSKFWRKMRIVTLLILISITQTFALESYAQTKQLSLNFRNEAILSILNEIEDQSDFYFMYDATIVDVNQRKSISCENQPITMILDQLLKDTKIVYEISDRQIVLTSVQKTEVGQSKTISGKVTDPSGSPLPGVTVVVKNTTQGTITNVDGNYSLSNVSGNATLVFSFVGMKTQEITVSGKTTINLVMEEEAVGIEEVVAVGYGVQKKANLTGAVASITVDELKNIPVANTSQLMYGRFSGVQITQNSGLAGSDASTIRIRGLGTFGNSTPLVVIDGMQFDGLTEFNRLAPSDIETITVLKDASAAAIYGARGANGIILVTTKGGIRDHFQVEYNSYFGFQKPTVVPDYADASTYAELINEKYKNEAHGQTVYPRYSEEQLQQVKDQSNPDQYANTDWADEILQNAPIQNHFLSFAGGSEKTTYRLSFGYRNQEAIVKGKFRSNVFTLNANINSKIKEWLTIGNITTGSYSKFVGPSGGPGTATLMIENLGIPPTIPVRYTNGEYGIIDGSYYNSRNPLPNTANNIVELGLLGDYKSEDYNINDRFNVILKPTEKLSLESSVTLNLYFNNSSDFRPEKEYKDWEGRLLKRTGYNNLSNSSRKTYRILNDNLVRYNDAFNSHNIEVLLGHSIMYEKNSQFGGALQNFPSNSLQQFDAGGVSNPSVYGDAYENALQSFFGRINYDYNGRYFLEANLRYDGSSKFGPNHRYATFPSFSAGWRITQESFMQQTVEKGVLTDLKIRGSWGKTGNNRIANYIYDQTYNVGLAYVVGDATVSGVAMTNLAYPDIKWETSEQYDVGFDASFFGNRLFITGDYFNRKNYDVLYTNFPIPATLGVTTLSARNSASVLNRGIEISIDYRQKINGFNFNIGGNFTKMVPSKVTSLGSGVPIITTLDVVMPGEPYKAYYGLEVLGIFQTDEEVKTSPSQFADPFVGPGDLKYGDISGPSGVPDNKVDDYDRTVIGHPYPEWLYSFNANMDYKGIDFGFTFQGIQNIQRYISNASTEGMFTGFTNALNMWKNRWRPENKDTNLFRVGGAKNERPSSFRIKDASYLRLKNIELGYTLPPSVVKNKIERFRIFLSGQNLLTFAKMKEYDPESYDDNYNANNVPLNKVFTVGVNLIF